MVVGCSRPPGVRLFSRQAPVMWFWLFFSAVRPVKRPVGAPAQVFCRGCFCPFFSPGWPLPSAGRHRPPGVRAVPACCRPAPARDCWSRKSTKQPKVVRSISASARTEMIFLSRQANTGCRAAPPVRRTRWVFCRGYLRFSKPPPAQGSPLFRRAVNASGGKPVLWKRGRRQRRSKVSEANVAAFRRGWRRPT